MRQRRLGTWETQGARVQLMDVVHLSAIPFWGDVAVVLRLLDAPVMAPMEDHATKTGRPSTDTDGMGSAVCAGGG
jgi:hypothetical protein